MINNKKNKIMNTMSESVVGTQKKQNWYNKHNFSLIPVLEIKNADEHNTKNFTFRWLFFKFWTLDHFDFEISFVVSTHWGVGFIGILPYLRWVITIPCPNKIGVWIDRKLSRSKDLYND